MTTYTGQDGVITIGGNTAAEVTAYSVDHATATIEKTSMGQVYREFFAGVSEWSGSADIYFSSEDTSLWANCVPGANATTVSSSVSFIGYPSGNATGNPKVSGNVVITGISLKTEVEGMVAGSISFQGTGALTLTTAS